MHKIKIKDSGDEKMREKFAKNSGTAETLGVVHTHTHTQVV